MLHAHVFLKNMNICIREETSEDFFDKRKKEDPHKNLFSLRIREFMKDKIGARDLWREGCALRHIQGSVL